MSNLWIAVGIPGSGKTTFIKSLQNQTNIVHISRDDIRFSMLKENDDYFKYENEVYNEFIKQIQSALDRGATVVADATHINYSSRKKLIRSLNLHNSTVNCLVFDTPFGVCRRRNNLREGRQCVPDKSMESMTRNYRTPDEDPYKYDCIVHINVRLFDTKCLGS